LFAISAVVLGFYLRSLYFQQNARTLGNLYAETQQAFATYQHEAEQAQSDLIDATTQMYQELTEEQRRAQAEMDVQERRHQDTLGDIWDIIEELEYQLREVEEKHQDIISSLSFSTIFPQILNELDIQQAAPPTVGLLNFVPVLTEDKLLERLFSIMNQLEKQHQILEIINMPEARTFLQNYPTLWPVNGHISSGFGYRKNPMGGRGTEHHNGVDIPARTGTVIRAAGGGTVVFAGWQSGYGNTVIIDHGEGISTLYAHNSRNRVTIGQSVSRGEIIANVGSTGRSTGPHLHYEVRQNGTAINPAPFLTEHHA
jgi:murein DD-endopeptidase MepM/ murein hydrolase activator NlpD